MKIIGLGADLSGVSWNFFECLKPLLNEFKISINLDTAASSKIPEHLNFVAGVLDSPAILKLYCLSINKSIKLSCCSGKY
jgi:hypothetical protein